VSDAGEPASRRVVETIPDVLTGERTDRVVAMLTGLSRGEVADLIAAGAVTVGGVCVTPRSRRVTAGEVLAVDVPGEAEGRPEPDAAVEFPVVYEDANVVVIDKPAGLVVHPGAGNERGTLVHGLLHRYPEIGDVGASERPGIVHRLDKGTSGLLVVARTAVAYDSLVAQLGDRSVERRYEALAWGTVEADSGLVDAPLGRGEHDPTRIAVSRRGKPARTRYTVHQRFSQPAAATSLECRLETGRTHQIRVHLAAIGHPVVGDDRYGGDRPAVVAMSRPFLHAAHLAFDDPVTGERRPFDSPLPDDLRRTLKGFRA
jgi:23S rRNA pseudouridine1911/1915/1917 synthase